MCRTYGTKLLHSTSMPTLQVLQNGSAKAEAQVGPAAQPAPAAVSSSLEGVPPLPACRVRLVWEEDAGRAAQVSGLLASHTAANIFLTVAL